ncbi:MAG: thioredoxin family protein [Nocardiaceae bacterium]|nr:thioredoxin family protein [Nocardiaceae bacterium]
MSGSVYPVIIGLVALALATAAGLWLRKRDGEIRHAAIEESEELLALLADVGFTGAGPAVVHFSADWCAPCKAVARVVSGVTSDLADSPHPPQDLEVDIDENPRLASYLRVLSLPTTFVIDRGGAQKFRAAGVPSANDLRTVLEGLSR